MSGSARTNWSSAYERPVWGHEDLASRSTWGIGGTAQWYAEPECLSDLGRVLSEAERQRMRVRVLGGGSNLLIRDDELPGLVLRLPSMQFGSIECDERYGLVRCGAAAPLSSLLRTAEENGFAGLEALAGIPGTVGGAVVMNAGTGAQTIGPLVRDIGVIDFAGRYNRLTRTNLFFGYRMSNLDNLVVTDVTLRMGRDDPEAIRRRSRDALAYKKKTQPLGERSAGCVFRNPPRRSAGELIDKAGCKGLRQGDAEVSTVHANFIINRGGATWRDTLRLIEVVRLAVQERFGIPLELEVKLWI
jgi:UDP-N-acetylmuramate dehydrogenase